jgi:hypothetical protein
VVTKAIRVGTVGSDPGVGAEVVTAEQAGVLAIEAEHFFAQEQDVVCVW